MPSRPSKLTYLLLFVLALGIAIPFGSIPLIAQDALAHADVIVVIGGDHKPARIKKTASLYVDGYAPKISISAGTMVEEGGLWMREAEVMKRQLASQNIPADAITLEQLSQTTRENALETLRLLQTGNARSILLVTSPYHSRRAQAIFNDVYGETIQVKIQPAIAPDFCALCWWFQADQRAVVLSEYWKWGVWLAARR